MSQNNPACCLYMKNVKLFSNLDESLIQNICGNTDFVSCPKSCDVYAPFEPASKIYIVNHGEVQLYHMSGTKKFVFDTLSVGSIFGNVGLGDVTYGHFAKAVPGSNLSVIDTADFMKLLQSDQKFMLGYMQNMSEKVREYQSQMQNVHAGAKEIVLHELTRLSEKRQHGNAVNAASTLLRITHKEIAELTGLNRVTVTRSINTLKIEGDIKYDEKTGAIEILA